MNEKWRDLKTRSVSAVILGTAVLFITWWNPVSFDALVILGIIILFREWMLLTRERSPAFVFFGIFYLALAAYSLSALRHVYGWQAIYALFALVWAGDIVAYFIGTLFGRHKIAPAISRGKSWEGLIGSIIVTALLTAFFFTSHKPYVPLFESLLAGAALAITGLTGDLFESSLKRKADVKDSGNLIPGHGGLFDRVDALMPCAILAAILVFFVY